MKVWLVCFLGMFGAVELYQWAASVPWLQQTLPLPIWVGGLMLAIGSNARKRSGLPWTSSIAKPHVQIQPPAQPVIADPQPSPQLPFFDVNLQPRRSISFTVRKPLPPPDAE